MRNLSLFNIQIFTDKTAIGLSLLCTLQCLAFPILIVLFPSVSFLQLSSEGFHFWLMVAVIPTSIYALTMGCKRHKQARLFAIGLLGIACLLLAYFFGHDLLGKLGEKTLTLIGALIIAYGHYKNYRLCQHQENCDCASHEKVADSTALIKS